MINAYFQKLVDEVTSHGGDILKFAGDAIFAEWRIGNQNTNNNTGIVDEQIAIFECVQKAATCGAEMVAQCSDYPVFNDAGSQISTLNIHCGIAFGEMAGVHVGNDYNRREFIVLGDSIDQVTKACAVAKYGELMASPEAFQVLQLGKSQSQPKSSQNPSSRKEMFMQPIKIASRNERFFEKKKRGIINSRRHPRENSAQNKDPMVPFDKMDLASLRRLQRLLSFYVHPLVKSDASTRPNNLRDANAIQERHRSEAELRSVYTLFIKPIIIAEVTNDLTMNKKTFELLNDVLNVVNSILDSYRGHLRQYIVDDKGMKNNICSIVS